MRRKAVRTVSLCGLLVALTAAPAVAEDVFDPPWDMTLPNQTEQGWECDGTSPLDIPLPATWGTNPYGEPTAAFTNMAYETVPGPDGTDIPTWHAEEGGGSISITIKNNEDPDEYKLLFWQVTADGSPTPTGSPPTITTKPPGGTVTDLPAPYAHHKWGDTAWYTYNGYHKIEPNPAEETITFEFVYCTNVSEIVINTVCVPEPATLSLVALGAAALLRRRRR